MDNKPIKQDTAIDINAVARGLKLRMGNTWCELGDLWQAVDVFLKIIEEYPSTEESQIAQSKLMSISRRYEQEGSLRLSLAVLERLEQAMVAA